MTTVFFLKLLLIPALANLSAILMADAGAPPCDKGWSYLQGANKCIKAFDDIQVTWDNGNFECEKMNGRLLTIHDQKTQDFVIPLLQGSLHEYWIGLTDIMKEGIYQWMDETMLTGYKNWAPKQPDIYMENCEEVNEDCVVMTTIGDRQWNDVVCSLNMSIICEKKGPGCKYKNGGCGFDCTDATDGSWNVNCVACRECPTGFANRFGKCYDIDECSVDNGGCDQICQNIKGSWECACYPDFISNGTSCVIDNGGDDTIIG